MKLKCGLLIIFLIALSCTVKKTIAVEQSSELGSEVVYDTTLTIDSHVYNVTGLTGGPLFIADAKGDTLLKEETASDAWFERFNDDDYPDLRVMYMTNVPDIGNVYLYDSGNHAFRKIDDVSHFPAAQRLMNTACYYSYHRSGCADQNWGSELFIIKDFKTYCIGRIEAYGCANGEGDPKDGIYVYKQHGENDEGILINTIPIDTIGTYEDYKWGFIADYWTKQYRLF